MDEKKHPQIELRDGETIWTAWVSIAYGGEPRVFCDEATVVCGEHRLVRIGKHAPRQLSGFEGTFASEMDARIHIVKELCAARDRFDRAVAEQTELAAAGRVVYAQT